MILNVFISLFNYVKLVLILYILINIKTNSFILLIIFLLEGTISWNNMIKLFQIKINFAFNKRNL